MASFTFDGTENRMRWDRRATGFMEVWYLTLNHRDSGAGLWLRYTITAPFERLGPPYCELWGFFFDPDGKLTFGGRQRHPINRLGGSNGADGTLVRIADSWLSESHIEGAVTSEDRTLMWSLDFEPAGRCYQHLPALLRSRAEKRFSTVCSPNLSVPFTGTVSLDGMTFEFDGERGCQSHRWGRRHARSWAWAHCSHFEGARDAVFEGLAARTSIGPFPAPTMTFLHLTYEGEEMAFNEIKWALKAKSRYEMPTWAFTASNEDFRITGAARATIDRVMQVTYHDPDGARHYCANSEIADLAVEIYRGDGNQWRHFGSLTALRTAHVEFGRSEPFIELPLIA
jgi:hypothetical protein